MNMGAHITFYLLISWKFLFFGTWFMWENEALFRKTCLVKLLFHSEDHFWMVTGKKKAAESFGFFLNLCLLIREDLSNRLWYTLLTGLLICLQLKEKELTETHKLPKKNWNSFSKKLKENLFWVLYVYHQLFLFIDQ